MDVFFLTVKQMLMMFSLIFLGYFLRKRKILPEGSDVTMAKLETYIFVPALSFYTMLGCNASSFAANLPLLWQGLIIIVSAALIAVLLSRLFVRNAGKSEEKRYLRNVFTYGLTFGNYGFMGNFIILEIWGQDVFLRYSIFTFFISVVCLGWGIYILIPKNQGDSLLKKLKDGMLTPSVISLVLGAIIGIVGWTEYIPSFLVNAMENAGKCQGPVAMILVGYVVAGFDIKKMFLNGKVYILSAFRLILLPAALLLVLKLLGANEELCILVLVAFATPVGLNTIIYPTAYGGDTRTGSAMTLISHIFSLATIPLMYLLFVVLL